MRLFKQLTKTLKCIDNSRIYAAASCPICDEYSETYSKWLHLIPAQTLSRQQ